jgi:UDP-glucose 4-epimerase
MNVLVIGCKGFIGSHLVNYYLAKGDSVSGIDFLTSVGEKYRYIRVLSHGYGLEEILTDETPDICFFAGGSASVQLSFSQPYLDFDSNVVAVARVLNSLLQVNPRCRFVHFSSAAVYGNPSTLPVKEDSPRQPISPYGWHKSAAEDLCKQFSSLYKLPSCNIRAFSVYGELQSKLLFWDLYQKANSPGDQLFLEGMGKESRDFLYIGDFISGINCVVEHAAFTGESYNVASGTETSIGDAARTFLDILGSRKELRFSGHNRQGDPVRWRAEISRIEKMGFKPKTDLKSGLINYSKWLQGNA